MYTGKKVTLTLALMISSLLLSPSPIAAEDGPFMLPFVFASAGGGSAPKEVQLGAGVSADVVFRQFGAGVEFQGFTGVSGSPESQAGALFATNGLFLFAPWPKKVLPFATGGYSRLMGCGHECSGSEGFNFGGGVMFLDGRPLRLEFRDHVFKTYGTMHKWEIRIGIFPIGGSH